MPPIGCLPIRRPSLPRSGRGGDWHAGTLLRVPAPLAPRDVGVGGRWKCTVLSVGIGLWGRQPRPRVEWRGALGDQIPVPLAARGIRSGAPW